MARGREAHEDRLQQLSSFGKELARRSKSRCELCGESTSLAIYEVPPVSEPDLSHCVMLCQTCRDQLAQLDQPQHLDANHWLCLNESAWSEVPAVQVLAWRLLNKLSEGWSQDLLDQLYLEPEVQAWAAQASGTASPVCVDSNGALLNEGDTVHLIKDLDVKGTSFVAKRGTAVKNIHLTDNPGEVEGLVNKTRIVLKTAYLKKAT